MPTITSVAVLGTGDMGSAIGRSLSENGLKVLTCLNGRSENSRNLALAAGLTNAASMEDMLAEADVLLSILPPAVAKSFASDICPLIRKYSCKTLFVDCNAVAPQTSKEISEICAHNDVRFQDAGIVGAAPRDDRGPVRFYTSGPWSADLRQLATKHIDVKDLGLEIGRASAMKMVYASLSKGTIALRAAAAIAAERLGVSEEIQLEWQSSNPAVLEAMQTRFPVLSADAGRWAGEMHEISQTYQSVGLTKDFHRAAAWMYEQIAATELGEESKQEAVERNRSMQQVINLWSAARSVDV